jgi:hypothetical protein
LATSTFTAWPLPETRTATGVLDGEEMFIKPEGFDEVHDRHGIQHRLKDARKWQPLGIGTSTSVSGAQNQEVLPSKSEE